jgi:photosystem II stability/assembly factor-like uncharacterized protein
LTTGFSLDLATKQVLKPVVGNLPGLSPDLSQNAYSFQQQRGVFAIKTVYWRDNFNRRNRDMKTNILYEKLPLHCLLILVLFWASALCANDQDPGLDASSLSGLSLRNIGPGMKSGRISDVVKDPTRPSTWYVAVASGNVWKTVNNGTTWTPIFDHHGSYSIGCISIDPKNPKVLWIGTGENNSQRSAGYGDGVYKSIDAGKRWTHMGLKTSEHIGKILIDPRDSQVVYVASQGPLWASGGERGLYKTIDGGQTWEAVLAISENTGISDIAFDPRDPEVLYATSYQRRRHVWALIAGGPESAIYKSTDAGRSWRKIVKGLPGVHLGRIGLAVSPQQPDVLYATVPASWGESGFYRSSDGGENWQRMSDYITTDPQYYQELYADPHRFDRVYSVDTFLQKTEDGGKTWQSVNTRYRHVDDHALVFDPMDPEYLLIGGDGGIYETWDRARSWRHVSNLPVTQFYRVGIDNSEPFYYVYGGTQDNGSLGAPSRTTNRHGIRSSDWFVTCGGDGYQTRVDPTNPNIVYSESQYGGLVRYDRLSGERIDIQPQPELEDEPLVWNWDSPLLLSPHSPTRLYFAANRLFRSDDRGDSWRAISPNLTREIDRNQLEVMGTVWSTESVWKNVWTSFYGNIVSLDESTLQEGLLYVGTDDGLIQVTEDGGRHWRKMEFFPGIPENTYVADLKASVHDVNTVFAVFNNHKRGDFNAYVLKSVDRGLTWTSISSNLPARHVAWCIQQDPVRSDLLFVGTEFGLFFSLDGGSLWIRLKGGAPTVAFRDLEIQARECDLVCGTFGRGIMILDDYSPLRQVTPELMKEPAVLFPIKRTWIYAQDAPMGGGGKASLGDGFFVAPNPPFGAVFTYHLKEGLQSRRQTRKQQERKREKAGKPVPYPEWDALREEDTEDKAMVFLTVRNDRNQVVRRVKGPAGAGIHRVAWNLRYARSTPVIRGNGDDPWQDSGSGIAALPGQYTVQLSQYADGQFSVLADPQPFELVPLDRQSLPVDRKAKFAFETSVSQLQHAVASLDRSLDDAVNRVTAAKQALYASPEKTEALITRAHAMERDLASLSVDLRGDRTVSKRFEPTSPSLRQRSNRAGAGISTSFAPTGTHQRAYEIAKEQFTELRARLQRILREDLTVLEQDMDKIGIPWTPGRTIPQGD